MYNRIIAIKIEALMKPLWISFSSLKNCMNISANTLMGIMKKIRFFWSFGKRKEKRMTPKKMIIKGKYGMFTYDLYKLAVDLFPAPIASSSQLPKEP